MCVCTLNPGQSDLATKGSPELQQSNEAFVLTLPGKCVDISFVVNKQVSQQTLAGRGTSSNEEPTRQRNGNTPN